MEYHFLYVSDEKLLEKVFRFRYQIMHEEFDWISSNPMRQETDPYDPYSVHFAVVDSQNNICATMRLIHHSPIGYPTEKFIDPAKIEAYKEEKRCEMSRIFIARPYRNLRQSKFFINGIVKNLAYKKMKEYGLEYCYGALEKSFLKLVNMYGIPYHPIDKAQTNYGKIRYPSLLIVKELEEKNPDITLQ